ncbi:hypothetical protein EBX31_03105 [bacterium]|nr:hypothetical protein [bacterium]
MAGNVKTQKNGLQEIPVVIFAGGNEVELQGRTIPKACVSIAGKSMIAQTFNHYQKFGYRKFLVCSGAGHEKISDEIARIQKEAGKGGFPAIQITIKQTGEVAGTAKRLRIALENLRAYETVALTYVDIVSDVDLGVIQKTHQEEQSIVTLTAVHLPTRFKALGVALFSARVRGFAAKPITENTLVCGGYYFLNPQRLFSDVPEWVEHESFENETLPALAMHQAVAYHKHEGFWQSIDSHRDIKACEEFLLSRTENQN